MQQTCSKEFPFSSTCLLKSEKVMVFLYFWHVHSLGSTIFHWHFRLRLLLHVIIRAPAVLHVIQKPSEDSLGSRIDRNAGITHSHLLLALALYTLTLRHTHTQCGMVSTAGTAESIFSGIWFTHQWQTALCLSSASFPGFCPTYTTDLMLLYAMIHRPA